MSYVVECFDANGRKLGYAYRGRVMQRPHQYMLSNSAVTAAQVLTKHRPEVHFFIVAFDKDRHHV